MPAPLHAQCLFYSLCSLHSCGAASGGVGEEEEEGGVVARPPFGPGLKVVRRRAWGSAPPTLPRLSRSGVPTGLVCLSPPAAAAGAQCCLGCPGCSSVGLLRGEVGRGRRGSLWRAPRPHHAEAVPVPLVGRVLGEHALGLRAQLLAQEAAVL